VHVNHSELIAVAAEGDHSLARCEKHAKIFLPSLGIPLVFPKLTLTQSRRHGGLFGA